MTEEWVQWFLSTVELQLTLQLSTPTGFSAPHPNLNRFPLPNGEHVSCVFWNGLYHITGTDIGKFDMFKHSPVDSLVRALVFRFEAFSRPVLNMKKLGES